MPDWISNLFPTTLMRRSLDGMAETNDQLKTLIAGMAQREANHIEGKSTEGGYQSAEDFFDRDHPAMAVLKTHIELAVREYSTFFIHQECYKPPRQVGIYIWGWAVLLKAGDGQAIHVHPHAHISGVYYVTVPQSALDTTDGGKISFYDPRPRANMNQLAFQITRHREVPAAGDILLFPSWLEHSVYPFNGAGERICISFNASLGLE